MTISARFLNIVSGLLTIWMVQLAAIGIPVLSLAGTPAAAHEMRPAIIAVDIDKSGALELRAALNIEAWIAGIGSEHLNTTQSAKAPHYDRLRQSSADELRVAFDLIKDSFVANLALSFDGDRAELAPQSLAVPEIGDTSIARVSVLTLTGTVPEGVATMVWSADTSFGDTVIRVARAGDAEPFFSTFLPAGEASEPISLQKIVNQSAWANLGKYVTIGFGHIVPKGLDHILFVVGLFLLSPRLGALSWQITGFTVAHSVTLALGIYGVVSVPGAIVEPLIAASIIFVAVENLLTDRLHRWRPVAVFGFGLMHGLGFASVLSEIELPKAQFVTSLIGFDLGVELGQLTVIAACFLGVGLWFRHRQWYRRVIAMPASAAIGLIAMAWFVERIA